jgi:hypothetical protein
MVAVDRSLTATVQGLREGDGNLIPCRLSTGINLANAVHLSLGKRRNKHARQQTPTNAALIAGFREAKAISGFMQTQ